MDIKNKTAYLLILVYLIMVAGASLSPVSLQVKIPNSDKLIHVLLYMFLGVLLCLPKISSRFFMKHVIPFGFGTLYGMLLELLQGFVPGRTTSFYDGLANAIGVVMGIIFYRGLTSRKNAGLPKEG